MDEFFEKNKEVFNELDRFINENRNNIRIILASLEMHAALGHNCFLREGKYLHYKGIRVISDPYYVASNVGFILKSNEIKFDLTCLHQTI